jgi:DNA-binding transcriptional regulator YdaS (Cro superfamily)
MRKTDAIAHFGKQAAIAAKLNLSRAAVSNWGDVVPLESARALEILSEGKCRVDESLYPAIERATAEMSTKQSAA